jgi:hypothetical protein
MSKKTLEEIEKELGRFGAEWNYEKIKNYFVSARRTRVFLVFRILCDIIRHFSFRSSGIASVRGDLTVIAQARNPMSFTLTESLAGLCVVCSRRMRPGITACLFCGGRREVKCADHSGKVIRTIE